MKFSHITCALALISAVALAGCAMTTGGSGKTTDGSGVVGRLSGDSLKGVSQVELISPKGWKCSGQYMHDDFDGTSTTVPLTCSDGRTGQGIIVFERFKLDFTMAFNLSDGERGTVTFALKG